MNKTEFFLGSKYRTNKDASLVERLDGKVWNRTRAMWVREAALKYLRTVESIGDATATTLCDVTAERDQYRRDFEAMSTRAQELARRVSELEAGLLEACEIGDEVGCTPEGQTREYINGVRASLSRLRAMAGDP